MPADMVREARVAGDSDGELLRRHRSGDREAFGELYDRRAGALRFYLHSLTGDAALADDLLQEAFLRLIAEERALEGESAQGLLFAIGRNLAIDESRKSAVRRRSHPRLAAEAGEGPAPEELEELSTSLAKLPEEQREVLTLKFHAHLTFVQIAEVVGVPEPTVKSRYRYAIEKLAELMSEARDDA